MLSKCFCFKVNNEPAKAMYTFLFAHQVSMQSS